MAKITCWYVLLFQLTIHVSLFDSDYCDIQRHYSSARLAFRRSMLSREVCLRSTAVSSHSGQRRGHWNLAPLFTVHALRFMEFWPPLLEEKVKLVLISQQESESVLYLVSPSQDSKQQTNNVITVKNFNCAREIFCAG